MAEHRPAPTLPIIVTVIWALLLLPGLVGALLSPMFFDAPGSMHNPAAIINALIVVSFPLLCILSIVLIWALWLAYKRRPTRFRANGQIVAALLPLMPIAYFVTALFIGEARLIASHQPLGLHSTIIQHRCVKENTPNGKRIRC